MLRVVAALALAAVTAAVPVAAQPPAAAPGGPAVVGQMARAGAGRVEGVVQGEDGGPLEGVTVSAIGAAMGFAVTDHAGRFTISNLPPGAYLLRAHRRGFAAVARDYVELPPSGRVVRAIRLRRVAGEEPPAVARVLAAGVAVPPEPVPTSGEAESEPVAGHPHDVSAWRLRHARRSVLRDGSALTALTDDDPGPDGGERQALWRSHAYGGAPVSILPFATEVSLLTTGSFNHPADLLASGLPRSVAYLAVGPGLAADGWSAEAALSQGDVSSWIVAASFSGRPSRVHAIDLGVSYGAQQYRGGNPAALAVRSDGRREVGALYGYHDWSVTSRLQIAYGARLAHYDYVDRDAVVSPRAALRVEIAPATRLRVAVAQRMLVPGAEEFLPPPLAGLWLPPERTFSPLRGDEFRVERVRRVEVGVDHQVHEHATIGVRRFAQAVDDQLVTIFGLRTRGGQPELGHYYVATAGSAVADGWGVRVSGAAFGRLRGSVEYQVATARWSGVPDPLIVRLAPSAVRPEGERLHDLATSVEADVDRTATRVAVLYHVASAYARPRADGSTPAPDARFHVQVYQRLPFLGFRGSDWELVFGVRSLFRDLAEDRSLWDELLVVRPPKRILGGLHVRF